MGRPALPPGERARRKAEYDRRWTQSNRERLNAKARERYAANKERERARKAAWAKTNIEKLRKSKREWMRRDVVAHPEKYRDEKHRARQVQYSAKRRAIERGSEAEVIDRDSVFERDGWVCQLCGDPVVSPEASLDHIIPISKGGPHTNANVQLAHLRCNQSKGAKLSA